MGKPEFSIDGYCFSDVATFATHITERLSLGYDWQDNLDAFDDMLGGGYGTPEGGFALAWLNADESRLRLGHAAYAEWLSKLLTKCHPSNVERIEAELELARHGVGQTLFGLLVEIIDGHKDIELRLQ